MQLSKRSQKTIAIGLFCVFLLSFVFLYNHFTTVSDPYIFEHEDKTLNFDVPSFYRGQTKINQIERNLSHEILNSSEVLIYCNQTVDNYILFKISLKNDTYDVNIFYDNDYMEERTKQYSDLEYNVESELSLSSVDLKSDYEIDFLSIEVTLLIST